MGSLEIYIQAIQLVQSGDIKGALNLVDNPNDYRNKVIKTIITHLKDDYEESNALSQEILNNDTIPLYDKIITYYWYSWNYLKIGDYKTASMLIDEGIELNKTIDGIDSKHAKAYLFNAKSTVYKETGDIDLALEYNTKGLELAKETIDLRLVCSMTNNLASTYFFQGKYKKSLDLFLDAVETAKESDNPRLEGLALGNIGEIYHSLGDLNTAKEYVIKSLSITSDLEDLSGITSCNRKLGEIEFQQGNLEKAFHHLSKCIEVYERINNEFFLCLSYLSMIKVLVESNQETDEIMFNLEVRATKSKNKILIQVYNLAQAIVQKNKNSLLDRGQAMINLEKIIYDKQVLFEITYEATIHYVELLIQEYILTEESKKLDKIIEMVDGLYEEAKMKNASIKEIECLVIKSKLQSISLLFNDAVENLNLARHIASESNLDEYTYIVDEQLQQRHEELNKYQQIIDTNSSLIDKIQRSGVVDYLKFVGTRL